MTIQKNLITSSAVNNAIKDNVVKVLKLIENGNSDTIPLKTNTNYLILCSGYTNNCSMYQVIVAWGGVLKSVRYQGNNVVSFTKETNTIRITNNTSETIIVTAIY